MNKILASGLLTLCILLCAPAASAITKAGALVKYLSDVRTALAAADADALALCIDGYLPATPTEAMKFSYAGRKLALSPWQDVTVKGSDDTSTLPRLSPECVDSQLAVGMGNIAVYATPSLRPGPYDFLVREVVVPAKGEVSMSADDSGICSLIICPAVDIPLTATLTYPGGSNKAVSSSGIPCMILDWTQQQGAFSLTISNPADSPVVVFVAKN